jgi:hypothetical protein
MPAAMTTTHRKNAQYRSNSAAKRKAMPGRAGGAAFAGVAATSVTVVRASPAPKVGCAACAGAVRRCAAIVWAAEGGVESVSARRPSAEGL